MAGKKVDINRKTGTKPLPPPKKKKAKYPKSTKPKGRY